MAIEITQIELMALWKLAIVSSALADSLEDYSAKREQKALTGVLIDVIMRADVDSVKTARTIG